MNLFQAFSKSQLPSSKVSNYFEIYDHLLAKYRNQKITIVEVGVAEGGSLYMWKSYLEKTHNKFRIIGIDIDPKAKDLEKDFEIFIGNQSDPKFWAQFYAEVGKIDILIDDGGHSNRMQIQTLVSSHEHINDGGMIVIEDVHQSLSWTVGNPHPYSFMSFVNLVAKAIVAKSPGTKFLKRYPKLISENVYSVQVFQGIVVFFVDKTKTVPNQIVTNLSSQVSRGKQQFNSSIWTRIYSRIKYNRFTRKQNYVTNFIRNFESFRFFRNL